MIFSASMISSTPASFSLTAPLHAGQGRGAACEAAKRWPCSAMRRGGPRHTPEAGPAEPCGLTTECHRNQAAGWPMACRGMPWPLKGAGPAPPTRPLTAPPGT